EGQASARAAREPAVPRAAAKGRRGVLERQQGGCQVIRASLLAAVAASATIVGCTARDASAPAQAAAAPASSSLRPARIDGHPNLNGVWQAMGAANWNLEGG